MRHPQSSPPLDRPVAVDLDVSWLGVNERMEPGTIPGTEDPSLVTAAINCRFSNGVPETRGGYVKPVGLNGVPLGLTYGGPLFDTGFYCGTGIFADLAGTEWLAQGRTFEDEVTAVTSVHFARVGAYPVAVAMATSIVPPTRITFTQAGPEMILWRDTGEPLHWSGDFADRFQTSTLATIPAGTPAFMQPLPAAGFGIEAGGRVVFPIPNTVEIGFADILAPRRWDATLSRYSTGSAGGAITGLAEWGKTLVVFKSNAIVVFTNWTGDLSGVALEPVTDQAGCISHRTITKVGGDLIWLGRQAVHRLTEVVKTSASGLTSSRQLTPVPVSFPIPKSMARVNWQAAEGRACAALADGLWYLAVPVDGSTVNNAIFVWDTRTEQWQGEDKLEAWVDDNPLEYTDLTRSTVFGRESVIVQEKYVTFAGGHGWHDGVGNGNIRTRVEFRGYALSEASLKRLRGIIVDTEEHGTSGVILQATTDGQKATQTLQSSTTRNRARYKSYGRADRTLANPDDNFSEANREDYAWVAGTNQIETATVAGTITGSGNALVTVTAAGMAGSPLAFNVAVLVGDTASEVAGKIRTSLRANGTITGRFLVHGFTTKVALERLAAVANDATLNIAIANGTCTGLTNAPTSSNTVSAYAGDGARIGTGIQLDIFQQHRLRGQCSGQARWVKPIVQAAGGRLRINAVKAEGYAMRE